MRTLFVALVTSLGLAAPAWATPWPVPFPPPVVVVHTPPPPPPPVYAYPPRPCADALWIDGRWAWTGRQWAWSGGYWQVPQRVVYAPAPAYRPVYGPVYGPVRPYPVTYAPVRPHPVHPVHPGRGRWR